MSAQPQPLDDVLRRVQGAYIEMPGLRLTLAQAQRLWGLDRTACDATYAGIPSERVVNFCGIGALSLVAALIRRAEVLVGNDSGLSHLAASVGVRVVVISGPGDPAEVAPFSPNAVTVKKSLYCSPCYRNTCYRTDHPLECLDLVDVDQVWDSIHNTVNLRKDPHLHTGET